jgi:hypothetical protein
MPAKGLLVRFYTDAVHLPARSEKEGRPMFEDREFVQIIPIGDTKTIVVREVTKNDQERFPEEYAMFKKGETMRPTGTLLSEWPLMRPAHVKMLEYLNIFTVEQLAEIDDLAKQRIGMGAGQLVTQAKAFLAKARDSAIPQALAAENERMKDQIGQLTEQMAKMAQMIEQQEPQKRGPGRPPNPPKAEQAAA